MQFDESRASAIKLDENDPLRAIRERFIIPEENGVQKIYFLGNSLGLQPKTAKDRIQTILDDWAEHGVEAFFDAKEPWMNYHSNFTETLSVITGSFPEEIVVMNQLTVNLHLLLVSFYRPKGKRYKILCEAKAFPSDQYAFETNVKHHGYKPDDAIIEVAPRDGERTLRTEDILKLIDQHQEELALVLFGGINYYTGQVLDMQAITAAGKKAGAMVGFDLAHAAGNIQLRLHDWDIDFACWCSYKYLNSGPGAIGGAFIHRKHHDAGLLRFAGWWGYDQATRFKMEKGFRPMDGAQGWQLSTPSLLLYATHRAALDIINEAGWENIQKKRRQLSDYTWYLLQNLNASFTDHPIEFITPKDPEQRGSQVSMLMLRDGKRVYAELMKSGMMVDWREPDVIRFAPVPLYNGYEEVWRFVEKLKEILLQNKR